ncbi:MULTISPECIES: immunity 8 family protein [Pseudomonas putida group]|uniref:immunity 8 family protein n=1 Tax=Pseudomonas putida group TaxID=136845 RepID=UPI0008635FD9|nr:MULTISPECIES: immunity 8 family protein [Pseudomonas putida group]
MRAELKKISADEVDIHSYVPDDLECFFITIRLRIGPEGADGGDDFEVFVCTPVWLERNVWEAMWARHFLIVKEFNYQLLVDAIIKCISQCEGDSWSEVALKLARFYAWEFEDYQA